MKISSTWRSRWFIRVAVSLAILGSAAKAFSESAAVQAIEQAPDPSAAVTAYANGVANESNDPKIHEAYVKRMVDLGLPELAYHQAHALTTIQTKNGLAWGVVAYVSARRGQMPEALAAINLAGQYAPDNKFVAHTAAELAAWYDFKAEKNNVTPSLRDGLARVRERLDKSDAYSQAYDMAKKAYQSQVAPAQSAPAAVGEPRPIPSVAAPQASSPLPAQVAPQVANSADQVAPLTYVSPVPEAPYSSPAAAAGYESYWGPDYYYDWGPGWLAPTPWCWWQPCGYWGGCAFWPFGSVCVYGGFDRFHHWHDGGWRHDGHSGFGGRAGLLAGGHNSPWWHQHGQGHHDFFGTPLRPSRSEVQMARSAFVNQPAAQTRPVYSAPSWAASRSGTSPAFGYGRRGPTSLYSVPRYQAGGGFLRGAFGGRSSGLSGGFHRGGGGGGGGFHGGGFHGGGFSGGGHRR